MPTITRDVMDQEELKEFSHASREILLAQADGYCRLEVDGDSPGEYELRNLESGQARGYKGKNWTGQSGWWSRSSTPAGPRWDAGRTGPRS